MSENLKEVAEVCKDIRIKIEKLNTLMDSISAVERESEKEKWRVEAGAEVELKDHEPGFRGNGVVVHCTQTHAYLDSVVYVGRGGVPTFKVAFDEVVVIKPAEPEEGDFVRTCEPDVFEGIVVGKCCNPNFSWNIQGATLIHTRQRYDFTIIHKRPNKSETISEAKRD